MTFSQSVEKYDKGCHKGEDVVVGSNTLYISDTVSITRYPLFNKCWPMYRNMKRANEMKVLLLLLMWFSCDANC